VVTDQRMRGVCDRRGCPVRVPSGGWLSRPTRALAHRDERVATEPDGRSARYLRQIRTLILEMRHARSMGLDVELRAADGTPITGLPDPSGGTFDAAGNFDRMLEPSEAWPTLSGIDPFNDTVLSASELGPLLQDIEAALAVATDGSERRGLLRLRVMAQRCQDEGSVLVFQGD
jgi:hypothetical protein